MKTMLKRGAGVLMPIFSLPSPYGIGTFGRAAYEFIDQLKRGRQTYWQVLPMGPTCYGDSPYQSYSAFAGNPYFIDLDTLKDEKLLTQDEIDACWWCDKQVMSLIGIFGAEFFLRLLSVPENVIGYSTTYLHIIYTFVFGSVVYNGCAAILNSVGDSKTPLRAVIASSVVNIVFDLFFIIVCKMGVAGAAYATILAQCTSAVICFVKVRQVREEIGLSLMKWKPEVHYIQLVVKTGFPAAFQSCMIALGGMSVQRLVNSFGSSTMAAYVAANRVDSVAIQVIVSIGTALSVFTGQNIAKNQYDRIREALYKTLAVMVGASVCIATLVLIFRVQLMSLFLDAGESAEAIGIGCTYLTIIGVAYVIAGVMQSYQNVIRGAGDVNTCMVAGLTELSGRIVFAYLLSGILGVTGIWIATPLSWSCGCVIPVIRYYSGRWKHKRLA